MIKTQIAIVSSLAAVMMLAGTASANAAIPSAPQGQETKASTEMSSQEKWRQIIHKVGVGLHPGELVAC
ncbi:hypothetical protein [Paenibacillus sp.]|jgi:hypothetical protein|uniref:hypothetical protein n=1 Tax=Paenibacillus sp. TaxID=58172 RepID=UPI002828F42B|nr:hypothetical protein [Paenibacillus sp.]MDR0269243.1 hypothetical protein [Paenibacillus sp.]